MRTRSAAVTILLQTLLMLAPVIAESTDTEVDASLESLARIQVLEDSRPDDIEELVKFLEDTSPRVRERALRALGRLQNPAAITAMARLTRDPEVSVRVEVAFSLGQIFDRVASPFLAPLIADPDARVREQAVLALGKTGDRNSTALILARGKDEDRNVRAAVGLAIATLGDQNATLEICSLHSEELDPQVRWRLVYALARLGDSRATDTLLSALTDGSLPLVRIWAVQGLRTSAGEPRVAKALLEIRKDQDWRVVVSLLQIIARSPLAFAVSDLEPLASHSSFHVRAQLAATSAAVGGEGAASLLEKLSQDDSMTVRGEAIGAMARLLDRYAFPMLSSAVLDEAWQIRIAVARAYSAIDGEKSDTALKELSRDADARVRAAAIEALGARTEIGAEAMQALLDGLEDPVMSVRGTAVDALLTRKDSETLPQLLATLESSMGRESYELRESLVRGLAAFKDERALPALRARLKDDFASVRIAAAESITSMTGETPEFDRSTSATDDPNAPPPPALVDPSAAYSVIVKTSKGDIVLDLFAAEAPHHVARFLQSIDRGLYDGLIFHRMVSNFVIQGGDPEGTGWGDAGFSLRDEINPHPYLTGTLGMPKAGKDTGGCQIFITHSPQPRLDGRYTVFGAVRVGMDVVDSIEVGDRIDTIIRADAR